MYMGPIVRAETSPPPLFRRLVGVPVLAISILVMLPWVALYAFWSAITLTLRALPKAPRTLMTLIDYAGTVALGR